MLPTNGITNRMWTDHRGIASQEDALCVNSSGVCRLCMLEGCSSMESIFRSAIPICIAVKINSVTQLSLAEGDGLPTMVCQQCLFQLDVADAFIRRCAQSDRSFRCLSTQDKAGTSCTKRLTPISLGTTVVVDNPPMDTDRVGCYLTETIVQDPDDQTTLSFEHPIKFEVEDDVLNYKEQASEEFMEENHESQEDTVGENYAGDNIFIKIEEFNRVKNSNIGTEGFDPNVLGFETNAGSLSNIDQELLVFEEKHKCSICSMEFVTRRGLNGHFIHHLRQQKKTRCAAMFRKKLCKNQMERTSETFVAPKDTNLKVQGIIPNNGQDREIASSLQQDVVVSPPLEKRVKCPLRPSDFPSRRSLAAHSWRAKMHKIKRKNKRILQNTNVNHPATRVKEVNQHVQNGASNNTQEIESASAKDDHLANKLTDAFRSDEYESNQQPRRNQILLVTNKFNCSICLRKFQTNLKRALHICHGKDAKEKIFQHRLRVRACKKLSENAPEPLILTGQGNNSSTSFQFGSVSENSGDVSQKEPEVFSSTTLLAGDNEMLAVKLHNYNSEKSSNDTTDLREAAKLVVQPVIESKQFKKFKCNEGFSEFSVSIQPAHHLRVAKDHNTRNVKQNRLIKASQKKSTNVPHTCENKGPIVANFPLKHKACEVDTVASLDDLSTKNCLLLEETTKGEAERILALQKPISINLDAETLSNTTVNDETLTQDSMDPLTEKCKCKSCTSNFLCSLSLARNVCHTKDHNGEKILDSRLSQEPKRTKLKTQKQLRPTKTREEGATCNFQPKSPICNELATITKQQVQTAQEDREDKSDLQGEISSSKNDNQSIAPRELSQYHTAEQKESNEQVATKKGFHLIRDSRVIQKKGQKGKTTSNLLEDSKELHSKESFLGRQDLLKLYCSNGGHQSILNRKLIVQLDRLTITRDSKKEVVVDCMHQTQSKSSGPTSENISINGNMNEESNSNITDIEKIMPYNPSASTKGIEIKKEEESHAERCHLLQKPNKFSCRFCPLNFAYPLSLGRHIKSHKKELGRKGSFKKANLVSYKNSDNGRKKMQKDVDCLSQEHNASPDSIPNHKPMKLCRKEQSCSAVYAEME